MARKNSCSPLLNNIIRKYLVMVLLTILTAVLPFRIFYFGDICVVCHERMGQAMNVWVRP